MTCTVHTVYPQSLNLCQAGQLLAGPGHLTSGLIAIGKRRIKLVLRLPSGTQEKTARAAQQTNICPSQPCFNYSFDIFFSP